MKIYKSRYLFVLLLVLLLSIFTVGVLAEEENQLAVKQSASFISRDLRFVMLNYIAKEYNCTLICDEQNKKVSIVNNDGVVIKIYNDVVFFFNEPVIDASTIEYDLGWTLCKHIADTDVFDNAIHAVVAGWLTYLNQDSGFTFYVGRCYTGYYFSAESGNHEKVCKYDVVHNDMHFDIPIVIENGNIKASEIFHSESEIQNTQNTIEKQINQILAQFDIEKVSFPESNFATLKDIRPVILKYILQKNNCYFVYDEKDKRVSVFTKAGELLANYKNIPSFNGEFTTDASILERSFQWENCKHEPNTDMFEKESDAVNAGWFTYFKDSQDTKVTFYIGNCYAGHYFSNEKGKHETVCEYDNILEHMHKDIPVVIESGRLIYENAPDDIEERFYDYAFDKKIKLEKPDTSLTKMVTVFYTEYAKKEGVQTNYFSYRDRVYRDYWEDMANYDATDYIFIPPYLSETDSTLSNAEKAKFHKNENIANLEDMANAIKSLIKYKSNAKIWIGTPKTLDYYADEVIDEVIIDFLTKAKVKLGDQLWTQNVAGMYLSQEALFGDYNQQRAQRLRIRKIIDYFKSKNNSKEALWIPYYEQSAERIAKVSQIADLFDYIIIQPSYFHFNGLEPNATKGRKQNVYAVKQSAQNNYITDSLGDSIKEEYSNTKIGMQLETQVSYFSFSRDTRFESLSRYADYLMAAVEIKDSSPTAFYSPGEPHCNKDFLIYKFYDADKLNSTYAVEKRLTDSIDKYFDYVFETREKEKVFLDYAKNLYLASDEKHTEESFLKAYNPDLIITAFYTFERDNSYGDLSEYINANETLPDYFDEKILRLLDI